MVGFFKQGNIYKITRITGSRDNILGISFADETNGDDSIEVVEWDFSNIDNSIIRTSKEEVLRQVMSGLKSCNEYFGTDYRVSKIYYVPSENGSESIYRTLFRMLLNHYHSGNEFQESKPKT